MRIEQGEDELLAPNCWPNEWLMDLVSASTVLSFYRRVQILCSLVELKLRFLGLQFYMSSDSIRVLEVLVSLHRDKASALTSEHPSADQLVRVLGNFTIIYTTIKHINSGVNERTIIIILGATDDTNILCKEEGIEQRKLHFMAYERRLRCVPG